MTTSTFGEHLKREREMRGVSLDEISAATRIGNRFLSALENEQWDRLPGGVFNRGFVRAISRYLGLDEENLLAEYALAVNERGETPAWTGAGFPPPSPRGNWLTWLLVAVLAMLVVGGAWAAWRRHVAKKAQSQATALLPADQPAPAQAAPQAPPPTAAPSSAPGDSPATTPAATAPDPAMLELRLEAGRSTNVSVLADGKSVFDGRIRRREKRQYQAREQFEVSARDSSALLLELNGQMLPPFGPPRRPGKVTLTRKDLKKSTGGPD